MSDLKPNEHGWPDRLIDDEGRPTHPWWYDYPDGEDKPCRAIKMILRSEALTLQFWPWVFSCVPHDAVDRLLQEAGEEGVEKELDSAFNQLADVLTLIQHLGLSFHGGRDCALNVAKRFFAFPDSVGNHLSGLSHAETRAVCTFVPPEKDLQHIPWFDALFDGTGDLGIVQKCIGWLDKNRGCIERDAHMPQSEKPIPLAFLAVLRPDVLALPKNRVALSLVVADMSINAPEFGKMRGVELLRRNLHRVAGMAADFEQAALESVLTELVRICDIPPLAKQGEIVDTAREWLKVHSSAAASSAFPAGAMGRARKDRQAAGRGSGEKKPSIYLLNKDVPLANRLAAEGYEILSPNDRYDYEADVMISTTFRAAIIFEQEAGTELPVEPFLCVPCEHVYLQMSAFARAHGLRLEDLNIPKYTRPPSNTELVILMHPEHTARLSITAPGNGDVFIKMGNRTVHAGATFLPPVPQVSLEAIRGLCEDRILLHFADPRLARLYGYSTLLGDSIPPVYFWTEYRPRKLVVPEQWREFETLFGPDAGHVDMSYPLQIVEDREKCQAFRQFITQSAPAISPTTGEALQRKLHSKMQWIPALRSDNGRVFAYWFPHGGHVFLLPKFKDNAEAACRFLREIQPRLGVLTERVEKMWKEVLAEVAQQAPVSKAEAPKERQKTAVTAPSSVDQGQLMEAMAQVNEKLDALLEKKPAKRRRAKNGEVPEWLLKAVMLVQKHPGKTDTEIAAEVRVHKSSLSKNKTYRQMADAARGLQGQRSDRTKGFQKAEEDGTQTIEAETHFCEVCRRNNATRKAYGCWICDHCDPAELKQ
ncbi:MAG: hypothetical protein AB1696_23380 [Planctomycetota bacterium]